MQDGQTSDPGAADPGAAEREGIVDQQAALKDRSEGAPDAPPDHPDRSVAEREGVTDQQEAAQEAMEGGSPDEIPGVTPG